MDRKDTAVSDRNKNIFGKEWLAWEDPNVPEYFNPTNFVLDKHLATEKAKTTALVVDEESFSYEEFLSQVCRLLTHHARYK